MSESKRQTGPVGVVVLAGISGCVFCMIVAANTEALTLNRWFAAFVSRATLLVPGMMMLALGYTYGGKVKNWISRRHR